MKLKSDAIKKGMDRAPARAMLRAVGLTDQDFDKLMRQLAKKKGYGPLTMAEAEGALKNAPLGRSEV